MNRLGDRVPRDWWDTLVAMEPPQMADLLTPEVSQNR